MAVRVVSEHDKMAMRRAIAASQKITRIIFRSSKLTALSWGHKAEGPCLFDLIASERGLALLVGGVAVLALADVVASGPPLVVGEGFHRATSGMLSKNFLASSVLLARVVATTSPTSFLRWLTLPMRPR